MEQTSLAQKPASPNTEVIENKKQFTGAAARAMKLLAQGVTEAEVASALGVDKSLISQFMGDKEFKEQLHDMIAKSFKDAAEIDENYQAIEKRLSKRLLDQTEFMMNPDQVLRTLKFANDAKRKIAPNLQNGGANGSNGNGLKAAILILPTIVRKEFIMNPNNEIIAVDDQDLVTLNSKSLDGLIESKRRQEKVPRLTNGTNSGTKTDPYSDL